MVLALGKLLMLIWPPVLGLLFAWGWRANGHWLVPQVCVTDDQPSGTDVRRYAKIK